MQASWTWFRIFKASVAGSAQAHEVSMPRDELITEDVEDACCSVLWMRAGQAACEPRVGGALQILLGSEYVDPCGAGGYYEGDVGTVVSCEFSADCTSLMSTTVSWIRTGKTSTIPQSALDTLRFFRAVEPRVGDLIVAAPGTDYTDASGVQQYAGGDSGSVVSVSPAVGSFEGALSICWAHSGLITECPLTLWVSRFNLIPLQSTVPSYIRYPLEDMDDRV
jgi:hypothetical protein